MDSTFWFPLKKCIVTPNGDSKRVDFHSCRYFRDEIIIFMFGIQNLYVCMIQEKLRTTLYRVSQKSWHFWIACQIKTLKYFREMLICMCVWLKVSSIIWHQKIWRKQIMHGWALATFVKGVKIRLGKNCLSVFAERRVLHRRHCRWWDEFMINYDGYGLCCVWHGLCNQKFMNEWECITFLITNGLWKSC